MVKPTFLALSIAAACPSIVYATDSLNTAEQQDLATQLQQLKLQVEALESRLAEQAKQKTEAEIQQNTIAATTEKPAAETPTNGIEVGGAVRTNFTVSYTHLTLPTTPYV